MKRDQSRLQDLWSEHLEGSLFAEGGVGVAQKRLGGR